MKLTTDLGGATIVIDGTPEELERQRRSTLLIVRKEKRAHIQEKKKFSKLFQLQKINMKGLRVDQLKRVMFSSHMSQQYVSSRSVLKCKYFPCIMNYKGVCCKGTPCKTHYDEEPYRIERYKEELERYNSL